MRAWVVGSPGPIGGGPLVAVRRPEPEPGPGEVLVRVRACGVCRTDLHLAEGDLPPRRAGVRSRPRGRRRGRRAAAPACDAVRPGRPGRHRLAAAHLRRAAGSAAAARRTSAWPRVHRLGRRRRLRRVATVPEAFAYRLPDGARRRAAAPLLCAGIIGYRALRRAELPPGGRLGIYGFGASAHLAAQVALAQGAAVHVLTRVRGGPRAGPRARGARRRAPADGAPPDAAGRAPSCSRRPASWCRWRCGRWTGAARSPSPASTSATSRR